MFPETTMPGIGLIQLLRWNLDLDYMAEALQAKSFPKIPPSQFVMKC